MKKVNISDVAVPLLQFVRDLGREPVILMHRGKPLAVIQPVWNADVESVSLSFSPRFLEIIRESRESIIRNGGIPIEQVRRELEAEDAKKNGTAKKPARRKRASSK